MSKLDRSKPFGEVWGDYPARFEQDGMFFNASEDEIEVEPVTVEDEAGKKTRVLRVKAVVQAEKQAKPAGKGRDKARAKGYFEVQRCIREEEPPTPRQRLSSLKNSRDEILKLRRCRLQELAGSLRNGLDAVTMKAIAKARRDRYASCEEFAKDLRRFLAGERVLARRSSPLSAWRTSVGRIARRNPALVPAIVLALIVGAAGTWLAGSIAGDEWTSVAQPPTTRSADLLFDVLKVKNSKAGVEVSVRIRNDRDLAISFELGDVRLRNAGRDVSPVNAENRTQVIEVQAKGERSFRWLFPSRVRLDPGTYSVAIVSFLITDVIVLVTDCKLCSLSLL